LGEGHEDEEKGAETAGGEDEDEEYGDEALNTALLGPRPAVGGGRK
jgi:hypothetical protein